VRPTSERTRPIGQVAGWGSNPVRPRGRDRVDRTCPGPDPSRRSKPAKAGKALAARVSRARRKSGGKRQKRDRRSRAPSRRRRRRKPRRSAPSARHEDTRGSEASGLLPQPTGAGGRAADDGRRKSGPPGCTGWIEPKPPRANSPGVRRQGRSSANSLRPPSKSRPEDERCRPLRRKRRVEAHAAERSWETPAVATPQGK